ncbi:DUF1876 domain-containing protein [Streptomyces caniscabiei]|uniref:DUF1876 domain-containing protein n=1 Tax=Streptomyces caniscabiei TaxID=2746961 RepID=A0A927L358_9ACTN|nr:DUF1876 domain-containing protein [Streptomyces caniscabiei]MBD9724143.1 DUF1876 domain-containing protein [Streptomyces caniscabiei]MDX3513127.1 DUF1876 domain-containing protein [Streptomyces caniscabiei]MDX3718628.1 DUF1876 domain-containing protein [Streptomyces caniscabiei]MDX3727281.1 DUF1876 domain-containing protein [Streptomyces caniscabiei]WEO21974.1 DUF1876 domain-containing protein [Streptomyces caniscabiei]
MPHTSEWNLRLRLIEDAEGTTEARLVLDTGTTRLVGRGSAHCHPADTDVPEIGDELAAGRAMNNLARQLMGAAERDIEGMGAARPTKPPPVGWPV